MNLVSQIKKIKKEISGQILFEENLSKYSWFNIGGSAKVVFKPKKLIDSRMTNPDCKRLPFNTCKNFVPAIFFPTLVKISCQSYDCPRGRLSFFFSA